MAAGARREGGFAAVTFLVLIGFVLAGLFYLTHGAIYGRANEELQRAADSLALAAASALRQNGQRTQGVIDIELGPLVENVVQRQLELTALVGNSVKVTVEEAEDDDLHETVKVELQGQLRNPLTFAGFRYAAPSFKVESAAHVMRWLMTRERFPIVIVVADASDRMSEDAPVQGDRTQWESLRQALAAYAERAYPSRFGLVVFRDARISAISDQTSVPQETLEFLAELGIPWIRDTEGDDKYDEAQAQSYLEYLLSDNADESLDNVRVLWTVPPELDPWEEVRQKLQDATILLAGGTTNLGNALAHAGRQIEELSSVKTRKTVIVLSNGRPWIPVADFGLLDQCFENYADNGEPCEVPRLQDVLRAYTERAGELRAGATSVVAIKLRSTSIEEDVCRIFREICEAARQFAERVDSELGRSLVERICGDQPGVEAGAPAIDGASGSPLPAGSGAAGEECMDETRRGQILRNIARAVRYFDTVVETIQVFSDILGPGKAIARYLKTRFWSTEEQPEEEVLEPLAGAALDEQGNDPRYYTQVNTPEVEENIIAAITHWTCVFDPLSQFRPEDEREADIGALEEGARRTWPPVVFLRQRDGGEERLRRLERVEMDEDDLDSHPWNRQSDELGREEGYRLVDERQLAVRLSMKSCEALGQEERSLVIRWGPPRLGLAPEAQAPAR